MSPEPVNGGEPLLEADIERLGRLYFSDPKPPIEGMAAALGRSTKSVFTELSRLGMRSAARNCALACPAAGLSSRPGSASGSAASAKIPKS
jgi:hypothetical protein